MVPFSSWLLYSHLSEKVPPKVFQSKNDVGEAKRALRLNAREEKFNNSASTSKRSAPVATRGGFSRKSVPQSKVPNEDFVDDGLSQADVLQEYERLSAEWERELDDYLRLELAISEDQIAQFSQKRNDYMNRISELNTAYDEALSEEQRNMVRESLHKNLEDFQNSSRSLLGEENFEKILDREEKFNDEDIGPFAGRIRVKTF